jgi:hypothetical protein
MSEKAVSESTVSHPDWALAVRVMLVGWLAPGVGHLMLGKRWRAVGFALIIFLSLAIGVSLDGNLYEIVRDRPLSILATLASMGMGVPYFFLRLGIGYSGDMVAPGFEYGSAFILTAGLMNLLLVLDCWDLVTGRKE